MGTPHEEYIFCANEDHEFYTKRMIEDAKMLFIQDGPSIMELIYQANSSFGSSSYRTPTEIHACLC